MSLFLYSLHHLFLLAFALFECVCVAQSTSIPHPDTRFGNDSFAETINNQQQQQVYRRVCRCIIEEGGDGKTPRKKRNNIGQLVKWLVSVPSPLKTETIHSIRVSIYEQLLVCS